MQQVKVVYVFFIKEDRGLSDTVSTVVVEKL